MVMMPNCSEKKEVQDFLQQIIVNSDCRRVFSLVGTDAGMEKNLPSHVQIVSAECQKSVYELQKERYPNFDLHHGYAHDILKKQKGKFDTIWLDFFGAATNRKNLPAVNISAKRLKKGKYLAITSNAVDRSRTALPDEVAYIESLGFKLEVSWPYKNGKRGQSKMKFMLFIKK